MHFVGHRTDHSGEEACQSAEFLTVFAGKGAKPRRECETVDIALRAERPCDRATKRKASERANDKKRKNNIIWTISSVG